MLFDGTSDVNLDMEVRALPAFLPTLNHTLRRIKELRSEPDPTRDWTGIVACTKLSFSHSDAQRIWNLNIVSSSRFSQMNEMRHFVTISEKDSRSRSPRRHRLYQYRFQILS